MADNKDSSSSINIFPTSGNITKHQIPRISGEVYVRITDKEGAVFGAAPITGLSIVRNTDYNLSKALSGDFYVTSFGDAPVNITISGLSLVGSVGNCDAEDEKASDEVMSPVSFYKKYSTTNAEAPCSLDICMMNDTVETFSCYITSLTLQCSPDDFTRQLATYSITLIGVEKEPEQKQ